MTTTVIFLSKDVFFWPVVKDAAQRLNFNLIIVRKLDDVQIDEFDQGSIACCLIDLSSVEAENIAATVERLRELAGNQARLAAFGPHVQTSRLAAAAEAGCNPVLSRGQFNAKLTDYLVEWLK